MRYLGWIKAGPADRPKLKSLGVEGKIIYKSDSGIFEHCNCSAHIVERLIKELPGFYPGAFTGLNLAKKQVPKEQQFFWSMK